MSFLEGDAECRFTSGGWCMAHSKPGWILTDKNAKCHLMWQLRQGKK